MGEIYSESVLASYVTYKELYANDNYRSAYQILAEFIKYIIATEEIYNFSVPELKRRIQAVFGFQLPNAVIKSTIKKMEYIEKIPCKEEYGVNRKNIKADERFFQYKTNAEKENAALTRKMIEYAEHHEHENISKNELIQELIAYLLDESNGGKYQQIISAFILENSEDENIVKQLNAIREGSILYLGLNCNITETGSITKELTLYLDMEVLFDIYGYNGEVFKTLANDLIALVKEANKSSKKIKLRYFEDTQREISSFFSTAEEIVRTKAYLKENVAMKAIVNGCKNSTDVSDKEADFFHELQYKYGIILDEKKDYYSQRDYVANLEEAYATEPETEVSLKYLSNINKLRKNQVFYEYTKTEFLFVTETWKTLELSKKIAEEQKKIQTNDEDTVVCGLAINMSFLTNILWYKLNRGFGAKNYPQNLDSVIKAKIVLSNLISQNVTATYNQYKKEYVEGNLTSEQMAGRLLGLRKKASKPEEITIDNLSDNLNFEPDYLCRYEEERELQRVELEEKEEMIQQLTFSSMAELDKVQSQLAATNEELKETKNVAESQQAQLQNQNEIIADQKAALDEKDKLLEKYQKAEIEKKHRKDKREKIRRFVFAILCRVLCIVVVGLTAYLLAKSVKADAANTVAIIVTIISIVIGAIDVVVRIYHKIFDANGLKVNAP